MATIQGSVFAGDTAAITIAADGSQIAVYLSAGVPYGAANLICRRGGQEYPIQTVVGKTISSSTASGEEYFLRFSGDKPNETFILEG